MPFKVIICDWNIFIYLYECIIDTIFITHQLQKKMSITHYHQFRLLKWHSPNICINNTYPQDLSITRISLCLTFLTVCLKKKTFLTKYLLKIIFLPKLWAKWHSTPLSFIYIWHSYSLIEICTNEWIFFHFFKYNILLEKQ